MSKLQYMSLVRERRETYASFKARAEATFQGYGVQIKYKFISNNRATVGFIPKGAQNGK